MPPVKVPQCAPYVIDEQPGRKFWCSCGLSANQPYCDGAHKGTDCVPVPVEIAEPKKVAWCGCKHSANGPFCDGSHKDVSPG